MRNTLAKLYRYRIEMSCNSDDTSLLNESIHSTNEKINNYTKTHFSWHCNKILTSWWNTMGLY